jgi:hypothetical protein
LLPLTDKRRKMNMDKEDTEVGMFMLTCDLLQFAELAAAQRKAATAQRLQE